MDCMKRTICCIVLGSTALLAQSTDPAGPGMPIAVQRYAQLVKYLGLDAKQTAELIRVDAEFQRYLAAKTLRAAQVESELRTETLKPVVDPLALGVRYAELEAICREARDTEKKTGESARKALTAAQLPKVVVLEQAFALLPVITEADSAHLVDAPLAGTSGAVGVVVSSLISGSARLPGCKYAADGTVETPRPLVTGGAGSNE